MMRSKYRHVAVALVGAFSLAACGDDESVSQDTDASSSGEDDEDDDNGDDPATTITTADSSGTTPDESSSGGPITTADDSSGDSGGACLIVPQLFEDPSFEGGSGEDSAWGNVSSLFGTPICDSGCGGPDASDGSFFVWIGGGQDSDIGGVAQDLMINAGGDASLKLDIWYGAPVTGDVFQILIDGEIAFELDDTDAATYTSWTEVEIDVSKYADGGMHEFDLTAFIGGGGSFYLDNVRLETCADGSAVTVGDSVDPPMTGGTTDPTGETDTDSGGSELEMCDDDLGDTVPQTVEGDNRGAGNEVTGSCTTMGSNTGEDVAYSFTAPATGTYSFDTLASELGDTVLYLLDSCMGGAEIACNDDVSGSDFRSSLIVGLEEGQTVAVVVDGWGSGDTGSFTLTIQQLVCEEPTDLGNEVPLEQDDDNTGAGDDTAASCGGAGSEDVVYTWTPSEDGIYAIYAVSLQMSPVVSAYSGTCGDPASEIGCAAGANFASINTALAADEPISIVVDAQAGSVGTFELDIDLVGTLSGDCCGSDDSPGCESFTVTQCVCADLPACCDGDWTTQCSAYGAANCDSGCPLVDAGSCCEEQDAGGCDVAEVQDCVCAFDAFCCEDTWDGQCIGEAENFCFADCG